ncbi:MAG: hypothetical protein IJH77_01830 [Mogibacterium sp.]|nr:hypothetical protein [Mogibacterium sp.]
MNTKKWIALFCTALLLAALAACKEEVVKPVEEPEQDVIEQEEEPEEESEPEEEPEQETGDGFNAGVSAEEAMALYAAVLEENREAILAYDWQSEINTEYNDMDPPRPVAFCDITGDGIPELFYMESPSPYMANLHICTVAEGKVRELFYPFDENETGLMSDVAAGGGNEYVLYTGKDGKFYLYYVSNNETSVYAIYCDELRNGQIQCVSKALNVMSPVFDENNAFEEMENIYYVNDEEVDASEGTAAFDNAFGQLDQVILYSGYDNGAVWKKIDPESALAMTYADAHKAAKGE